MKAQGNPWAIEACGLSRHFGSAIAVRSLHLKVHPGEMFGIIGPDGAGKSTAIRLLCGLLKPSGGHARILGMDLARDAHRIKARIGYLSQAFTLYGDLSVDENIEFFADLHGIPDFEAQRARLLDMTRLAPFRHRLADALSGGMKKKLALACTLIHAPDVLFLDEPSTGVDPVSRSEFWNLLGEVISRGVTVLMTTPYLDEAERCHRIGLMHAGEIAVTGTPAEVKARMPGQVYRFTSPRPALAYRALRRRWSSAQLVIQSDTVKLWSDEGEPVAREAYQCLLDAGIETQAPVPVAPSMEDAFVALLVEKKAGQPQEQP
jgi:ABC-2 type transport system ATP-binding protein